MKMMRPVLMLMLLLSGCANLNHRPQRSLAVAEDTHQAFDDFKGAVGTYKSGDSRIKIEQIETWGGTVWRAIKITSLYYSWITTNDGTFYPWIQTYQRTPSFTFVMLATETKRTDKTSTGSPRIVILDFSEEFKSVTIRTVIPLFSIISLNKTDRGFKDLALGFSGGGTSDSYERSDQ